MTKCSVSTCDRPSHALGFCKAHYEQVRRHGHLSGGGEPIRLRLPWPENLLQRMEPQPNGCIHFTGRITASGYGVVRAAGKDRPAHVAAWELHHGVHVPRGFWVDHQCHNGSGCAGGHGCLHRRCVNWEHLAAVTPAVNILASHNSIAAKYADRDHCKNGHEFTPENTAWRKDGSGGRRCVICRQEYNRRSRERKHSTM